MRYILPRVKQRGSLINAARFVDASLCHRQRANARTSVCTLYARLKGRAANSMRLWQKNLPACDIVPRLADHRLLAAVVAYFFVESSNARAGTRTQNPTRNGIFSKRVYVSRVAQWSFRPAERLRLVFFFFFHAFSSFLSAILLIIRDVIGRFHGNNGARNKNIYL